MKGDCRECYNLILVGYVLYDDLEVVFFVVVLWVENDKLGINFDIGKEVLDVYFDLKNKRLIGEVLKIDVFKEN